MGLSIQIANANFSYPGLPVATRALEGFSRDSLSGLYLFADANPTLGIADASGQANAILQSTANAHTGHQSLAGGGLRIRGLSQVIGPNIDLSQPFTMMLAGRFNVPTNFVGSSGFMAAFGTDQYGAYQRGFLFYDQRNSIPTTSDQVRMFLRPTNKGAQDGVNTRTVPQTSLLTFDDNFVAFLRCTSAGNFALRFFVGSQSAAAVDFATTLPYPQIVTNSGEVVNPAMKATLGSQNVIWSMTDLSIEVFAVYSKALSANEEALNVARAFSLIASRGR